MENIEQPRNGVNRMMGETTEIQERLWIDSNLTQFDDVLRANYDKPLEEFGEAVIHHIASLTNALRGVFFVLNEDQTQLDALGGFACTRDTMPKSSFKIGEDLIGQAVKSKKITFLKDLPLFNLTLDAAAGKLSAGSLVILPLIFNNKAYGVLELVYLHNLGNKYLDLLERLANNVAAMLQSIQNNIRTKQLLEESQDQADRLKTQEEELRQNLEELSATQEAMARKQKEVEKINDKLGKNQEILNKALLKARQKETELKALNAKMQNLHFLIQASEEFIAIADLEGRCFTTGGK